VVSVKDNGANIGPPQPGHLRNEEESCVEVFPSPVIKITCDDHEVDLFGDRLIDQALKGSPSNVRSVSSDAPGDELSPDRALSRWTSAAWMNRMGMGDSRASTHQREDALAGSLVMVHPASGIGRKPTTIPVPPPPLIRQPRAPSCVRTLLAHPHHPQA